MPKLETFQKDPTGSVIWTLDESMLGLLKFVSTLYCIILSKMWGIKLGSGSCFYGVTHFKRFPLSEITIGESCIFRSAFRSNFVGLNRACGISTHSKQAAIKIGDLCGFSGTSIGAYNSITIGNHVGFGANTIVTDFDWHPVSGISEEMQSEPVIIEDNVWVGMNCVILKGVHIGRGTILGANSVVTKSLPEMVIAAGSPAKVIREIL